VPPGVLTQRQLNRALLDRQLLLERADLPIPEAIGRIGGMQTQYAPSGYVGLWTRLRTFDRDALTRALEDRSVVQATLLRNTIHMVPREDFWPYAVGVRAARRAWWRRLVAAQDAAEAERAMEAHAVALRQALADGPKTVKELGGLASGFLGNVGMWVDLVRVPPSGTWERRRADRLGLAADWVGPEDVTPDEGLVRIVVAHLRAFGPAPWRDIAAWAGVPVAEVKRGADGLAFERYRDEHGSELLDLPGQSLPDPDTPAPVRFLPHWDATLLVHARRTGILPEAHRPRIFTSKNPFSVGTVLVDGRVVAAWSARDGRIVLDPYEEISAADRDEVEEERARLEAFQA
jgi:hypothetical protein